MRTGSRHCVTAGRVYPSYETPQELDLKRKIQLGRGLPPVYDRAALTLTDADMATFAAESRRPHWRFRLDHDAPIAWDDRIRGPQRFDPKLMSDPVIRRGDGSWLYHLPSVIDDVDLGISHVCVARIMFPTRPRKCRCSRRSGRVARVRARGAVDGAEGKLSKRLGSTDVDHFREEGIEPLALAAKLARIGTSLPVEPVASLKPLIEGFEFKTFGRAPARFDEAELARLNAQTVHLMDYERVAARLPAGMDARTWEVVRPNLERVSDAVDWWAVVEGSVARRLPTRIATISAPPRPLRARSTGPAIRGTRSLARLRKDRPQGQAAVPPAAPRADRDGSRTRHGRAAAAYRPRAGHRTPGGGDWLSSISIMRR